MTLAIAVQNKSFKGRGSGELYLLPYPTVDGGATNTARVEAILAQIAAATPFASTTNKGVNYKAKEAVVTQTFGNGDPDEKIVVGVESATVETTIHEVDPAHLANIWGCDAGDVIPVAATAAQFGQTIIVLGKPSNATDYMAVWVIPSSLNVAGANDYHIWPRVSVLTDPDLKFDPKNPIELPITLQAKADLYIKSANGAGAVHVLVQATAAKTA